MSDRHYPDRDPWANTIDMLNPHDWQLQYLNDAQRAHLLTVDYYMGRAASLYYGIVFPRFDGYGVIMLIFQFPELAAHLADEIIYGETEGGYYDHNR